MFGVGRRGCPESVSTASFGPVVHLPQQQEDDDPAEQARDDASGPPGAGAEGRDVEGREDHPDEDAGPKAQEVSPWAFVVVLVYSHSMVPGGLLVMSRTT